jgi:NAD-dependent SIR2 family protein deacetylase
MNNKERLFELIRREEVVVWAGAGLSMYAGYPSGAALKNKLYESLTKSEKRHVRKSNPLPDFAEDFVRIRNNNRNELLRILEEVFISYPPKSNEHHIKLASIPHIHSIITTNYDKLFENSYKEKGQVVHSPKNVPYIDSRKTQIFKVHGDLSDPESIIITKSDYLNFFSKDTGSNDLWTTIKGQLLTKNIVFIGYNVEDPNVEVIFNRITDSLGEHRRECFLVAPSLKMLKRDELKQKGISYINAKGENFIDELIQNIEANIFLDLEKGIVSSGTCGKFGLYNNISFDLNPTNNKLNLSSIRGIDKSVSPQFKFTYKDSVSSINKFNDFMIGKKVGKLELDVSKMVKPDFNIGGIQIPYLENADKLILKSIPQKNIKVDIIFDNGFEFNNIPTEVYGNYPYFHIHSRLKTAQLEIKIEVTENRGMAVKLDYTPNRVCSKISEEITDLEFLGILFGGTTFKIYWDDSSKFITQSVPIQKPFNDYVNVFMTYFKNLKTIENHFDIRFSKLHRTEIDNESHKIVDELITLINKGTVKYNWNGTCEAILFDNSKETINTLKKKTESEDILVVANEKIETKVVLHGQTLILGYKCVKIENPYIQNLQEMISNNVEEMKLGSKSNKLIVSYTSSPNPQGNYIIPSE